MAQDYQRGEIKGPYLQGSIKGRILAFLLDNVGKIVTGEQLAQVATLPGASHPPPRWHQRVYELRADHGYNILTQRDDRRLGVSEYVLQSAEPQPRGGRRVRPTPATWLAVLTRAGNACEWIHDGRPCGLREGDTDPITGGTVHLTPDHRRPHAEDPATDPSSPDAWQALCARHQVMKKN
jgi:hypothetical protein